MTQVISNDVSAITPELWSSMVQVPLYKSLVALEVASMKLSDTVQHADTIHVPRFADLSATVYTPGTTITATAQDWAFDNLVVSSFIHSTFYVNYLRTLGVTLSIKLRKLRETLLETIRSETQKWGRSETIIGVSY